MEPRSPFDRFPSSSSTLKSKSFEMNFLSFLLYIIPLRVNSVITIITTTMVAIKRKKGTNRISIQLGQSRCAKKFDGFGILYSICERKSVSQPQTSFIRVKSIQTSGIVSRVSPPPLSLTLSMKSYRTGILCVIVRPRRYSNF